MDIDDDVSFADDDSYSYQPPARRLYDGRERFNVPNTNSSSRSNRSSGAAFCRLLSLQNLDLSNNQLTGELPDCWWDMQPCSSWTCPTTPSQVRSPRPRRATTVLSSRSTWSGNGFTGHFPSVVNGCSDLATIYISNNRFFGPIPPWIGHGGLPSLKILSLNSNKFIGEIPLELSRLSNLQLLVLANNSLTGVIPKELGNLISMKHPKIVSTPQSLDGSNYRDRIDNISKKRTESTSSGRVNR
jgi:Leucine-rich repeat (LRR) protein